MSRVYVADLYRNGELVREGVTGDRAQLRERGRLAKADTMRVREADPDGGRGRLVGYEERRGEDWQKQRLFSEPDFQRYLAEKCRDRDRNRDDWELDREL